MLVFGKNVFYELCNSANAIRKVYINDTFKDQKILDLIKRYNINYIRLNNQKMNCLVDGNHQGIVMDINEYEYAKFEEISNDDFIVMLDHLEDPHNLGAIIRSCEAAGVKAIIIPKDRCVGVNATVIKISSGAIANVKIHQVSNLINTIKKLKDNQFFIYGADMSGKDYKTIDYAQKVVLVIGNEGAGLSKLVKENCDEVVKINMLGNINSLNASVAAGILIFGIKKDL